MLCGPRMGQQEPHDVIAAEAPAVAEDLLHTIVVLASPEAEAHGLRIERVAGERARGLAHVALCVVPFAEGEEFEELSCEILVGVRPLVGTAVEVDHHRGVARDGVKQLSEAAERVAPQQPVLFEDQRRPLHLAQARREMAVPKERHAFGEGAGGRRHLFEPPGLELKATRTTHLPQALAVRAREAAERGATERRIAGPRGWERVRLHPAIAEYGLDGATSRQPVEAPLLSLRGSKPRALQDMFAVVRHTEPTRRGPPA